jgi:hypothetical protein
MIADLIVIGAILFAVVFVAAWLVRPDLRTWIERPKHRFQADVRRYDQVRRMETTTRRSPKT